MVLIYILKWLGMGRKLMYSTAVNFIFFVISSSLIKNCFITDYNIVYSLNRALIFINQLSFSRSSFLMWNYYKNYIKNRSWCSYRPQSRSKYEVTSDSRILIGRVGLPRCRIGQRQWDFNNIVDYAFIVSCI